VPSAVDSKLGMKEEAERAAAAAASSFLSGTSRGGLHRTRWRVGHCSIGRPRGESFIGDETIADAVCDRLVHNGHKV
jgi:hypothetical protein